MKPAIPGLRHTGGKSWTQGAPGNLDNWEGETRATKATCKEGASQGPKRPQVPRARLWA